MSRGFYALLGWLTWQLARWYLARRLRSARTPLLVGAGVLVAAGAAAGAQRQRSLSRKVGAQTV